MDRFTYFLVRVRQPFGREAGRLAGLVERLATGEKRSFASGEELLRSVAHWPDANMGGDAADLQNDDDAAVPR
jgi:hypothetical protein